MLTPANVPRLRKLREFAVDEKIDVTPLVVGDKLYVCSMTNTVFVFDVNTGAELVRRQLAFPFDPRPDPGQMDRWKLYHNWGITATPVIDVATKTIYLTAFGKPQVDSQNTERNNMLFVLDATTLADRAPPVLIAGNADNGGGAIANGFTTPYQKLRAGLGLLFDAGGSKAVIISLSINGENPRGPGHGFVVAYDVRGLHREAGFAPTAAIWNATPGGGAGGVWMSGSGPAIDGNDIYLATGNGMDPGTLPGNFGESFVKLRYTAGVAEGKPMLVLADFWGAFSDFGRQDEDQASLTTPAEPSLAAGCGSSSIAMTKPQTTWGTSRSTRRRSLRTKKCMSARSATRWCSTASEAVWSECRLRAREVRSEDYRHHDRLRGRRLHQPARRAR